MMEMPQVPIYEEKREPVRHIQTAAVESLKVLDTQWPIREADIISQARDIYSAPP